MEMIVALHNIRSAYNVGAILRTCDGFGVSRVIQSGYTPRVHDKNLLPHLREKLDREIHKTALGAEDMLDIYSSGDIISTVSEYKKNGYKIVGLENNINDSRLLLINSPEFKNQLSGKIVLVLGEEVHGIDKSLYDLIDVFAEIPMYGGKESFNVSVAAGISIYAIMSL